MGGKNLDRSFGYVDLGTEQDARIEPISTAR
jgi:hypothetical protein